jgi:hypothetical protein
MNRVEAATRQWIRKFVIRERLCPFAAASNIIIKVDEFPSCQLQSQSLDPVNRPEHAQIALSAIGRAEHEVGALLRAEAERSTSGNLFLVWPTGLEDLETYRSFVALLAHRAGIHFAGVTGEGTDAPAVTFPFHPQMTHARGESGPPDYRFASPFPMAHIIPQTELASARQQLKERKAVGGACLLRRNTHLMSSASAEQQTAWESVLNVCRRQGRSTLKR